MHLPRRAAGLVSLLACAAFTASAVAAPPSRSAADPLSADALMATVSAYAGLGPDHLTGTAREATTQDWFARQLTLPGMTAGSDSYSFEGFLSSEVSISVAGKPIAGAAYLYSGVTGTAGVTAPLVDVGAGTATEFSGAAGKIAVVTAPGTEGLDPTFATAFGDAQKAGVAGLVVVTEGPDDYPVQQDVDSRVGPHTTPTIILGAQTGQALVSDADAGDTATLTLTAAVGPACDRDVWAMLPGADPNRLLIVGTPTSGFDPSASERGAGVAVVLALAAHEAALPLSQRPETLVFAGLSGHEVGYLGLQVLEQAHPDWFAKADAYLHLGASVAALSYVGDTPGATEDETRLMFTSENPTLVGLTTAAFTPAQPIAQVPPVADDPGEQAEAYAIGVPIVAISGSSRYFHTAGDLPAGVGAALLAGVAQSYANEITALGSATPGSVRAANTAAVAAATRGAKASLTSGTAYPPKLVASCQSAVSAGKPATRTAATSPRRSKAPSTRTRPGGRRAAAPRPAAAVRQPTRTLAFTGEPVWLPALAVGCLAAVAMVTRRRRRT